MFSASKTKQASSGAVALTKSLRFRSSASALNAKTAINASTDIDSLITASTITWANDPNYVAL